MVKKLFRQDERSSSLHMRPSSRLCSPAGHLGETLLGTHHESRAKAIEDYHGPRCFINRQATPEAHNFGTEPKAIGGFGVESTMRALESGLEPRQAEP